MDAPDRTLLGEDANVLPDEFSRSDQPCSPSLPFNPKFPTSF